MTRKTTLVEVGLSALIELGRQITVLFQLNMCSRFIRMIYPDDTKKLVINQIDPMKVKLPLRGICNISRGDVLIIADSSADLERMEVEGNQSESGRILRSLNQENANQRLQSLALTKTQ